MATAGKATRIAVTTTATSPASGDLGGTITSSGYSPTWAELDTTYQGSNYTSFEAGLRSAEVSISGDWDSADPAMSRLKTAFDSGATVYVHFLTAGTTGDRVPVKVPSFSIESSVDGKVTYSCTVKSVGAPATVTLS